MPNLSDILANREWLWRTWPFPHVVARSVFSADFHEALSEQFRGILDRGLSDTIDGGRFSRSMAGYDAYGIGFDPSTPGALATFMSPEWRDMMCGLFGIGATPYVFAGAHHHAIGSANGFVHNDYNPVWFPRATGAGIQSPNNAICHFRTGAGSLQDSAKVQLVRGAVVLYYLFNDDWQPGDGGETGLFASSRSDISDPVLSCPPINNSLVAFECTPHSFHTFLSNKWRPRNSIIMWVHRTMEEATRKFGDGALERWKS